MRSGGICSLALAALLAGNAEARTLRDLLCGPWEWNGGPPPRGAVVQCGSLRYQTRSCAEVLAEDGTDLSTMGYLVRRCRENMDGREVPGPDGEPRVLWTLSDVVQAHWAECAEINAQGCRCE